MKRKIIALLLTMGIVYSFNMGVFAVEKEATSITKNDTRNSNTADVRTTLAISSNTSLSKVKVVGKSGTTKIYIEMTLQKKSGGSWGTVQTWSDTKKAKSFSLSKNKTIKKGTYRVKGFVKVYKGKHFESITTYTDPVKC